jgi:hypothetical protein
MICITSLEENEDEKCNRIIQQLVPSNDRWKFSYLYN